MSGLLEKILSMKGVLYVVTRFGGTRLRRIALSGRHASGGWNFLEQSSVREMVSLAEEHCSHGRILDMGCGTGSLGAALDPQQYESYLGVELSKPGLEKALSRGLTKPRFEAGDIQTFDTDERFDLIVFEETLYYVNPLIRRKTLERYSRLLKPGGRIIVTAAEPKRFANMLDMIRSDYEVLEDRTFTNSRRHLMVFRLKS